jgi:hypothetical protein
LKPDGIRVDPTGHSFPAAAQRLAWDFFHESRDDVLIHCGIDGVGRVWPGMVSMQGVTERGVNMGRD